MIAKKVKETIRKFSLVEEGDRVLVAVSGGADSVSLLCVLHELAGSLGIELGVAHLHHGLRDTADRDLAFVRELALRFALPFHFERADVKSVAEERGLGLEEAARFVRYGFLERMKEEHGYSKVALGHTLDDNVETFLLRVVRGGSLEGLKGIPPKRDFWIRPLIETKREELLSYLKERGMPFVVDESNEDLSILRNWVRLKLIPVLKEKNPSVVDTLSVTLEVLRQEHEFIEKEVERSLSLIDYSCEKGRLTVSLKEFRKFPTIIKRKLLFKLLYRYFYPGLPNALGYKHVEEILKMASEKRGSRSVSLPMGIVAVREYDTLVVKKGGEDAEFDGEVMVTGCGTYIFGDYLFEVSEGDYSNLIVDGRWNALFSPEKLKYPLIIRYKRAGDRILIKGVGRKKLQDFFVDKKVPRSERGKIPLLVDREGNVLWIVGYRQREDLKPETGRGVLIKALRRDG